MLPRKNNRDAGGATSRQACCYFFKQIYIQFASCNSREKAHIESHINNLLVDLRGECCDKARAILLNLVSEVERKAEMLLNALTHTVALMSKKVILRLKKELLFKSIKSGR